MFSPPLQNWCFIHAIRSTFLSSASPIPETHETQILRCRRHHHRFATSAGDQRPAHPAGLRALSGIAQARLRGELLFPALRPDVHRRGDPFPRAHRPQRQPAEPHQSRASPATSTPPTPRATSARSCWPTPRGSRKATSSGSTNTGKRDGLEPVHAALHRAGCGTLPAPVRDRRLRPADAGGGRREGHLHRRRPHPRQRAGSVGNRRQGGRQAETLPLLRRRRPRATTKCCAIRCRCRTSISC